MELTQIIQIESTNKHHIYLYHRRGIVWGCCGRSACLLHKIYPNIFYSEKTISGWGNAVPVMVIDPFTLEHFIGELPPIERDEERMVFEIPEDWRASLYR